MAKEKPQPPPPEALVAAANVRLVLAALDGLDWSAVDRPRLLRLLAQARDALDLLIGYEGSVVRGRGSEKTGSATSSLTPHPSPLTPH